MTLCVEHLIHRFYHIRLKGWRRHICLVTAEIMFLNRFFNFLKIVFISTSLVLLTAPEWPIFHDERYLIDTILGQRYFDFVIWETNALAAKGEATLAGGQAYLSDESRKDTVLEYLRLVGEAKRLEAQVNLIYSDPEVNDPDQSSSDLQDEIRILRTEIEELQPIAESILQEQVSTIIVEEEFDIFDRAWPPVQMHMTPLPNILIVSPRQEIKQIHNIPLEHGLTSPVREEIESTVLDTVDRSALVVGIGGLGFYPAMIVETSDINFLVNTIAHEWAHHWLTLHPLGLSYAADPVLRTMNETVASIFGDEVGARVIERYYPEFIPEPEEPAAPPPEPDSTLPPKFDFRAEMAETRNRVDDLLAQGEVEQAEHYMEERRQFFWDNGYRIRKLNQAYFAFYGAYADIPGEQGDDPIGPAILAIRNSSQDIRDFMDRMASLTSLEALLDEAASRPEL